MYNNVLCFYAVLQKNKKNKKNCSDIKKIDFYKKIELLIFYKIFSGGRTSLIQGTTGVCECNYTF